MERKLTAEETTSEKNLSQKYKEPDWLFKTDVSDRYFYAIGYNTAKLLDKLIPGYKFKLFSLGELTTEDLLSSVKENKMNAQ